VNATLVQLHAIAGILVVVGCVVFAIVAWISVAGVARGLAGGLRVGVAALAVVAGAIGLALTLRGDQPAEWLHWVYGGALVLVPVAAGAVVAERSERSRSMVLAVTSTLLALIAWRAVVTG
jgi:hypothetical protein